MECPYCNNELEEVDSWGNSDYILRGIQSGKSGDIFKCSNHEGFTDLEKAQKYLEYSNQTLESLGITSLEEVVCESAVHHVSGSFYTDRSGNLNNGYPC